MRKILIGLLVSIFCLGFSRQELTQKARAFSSKQVEITSSSGSSAMVDHTPLGRSRHIVRDDTVSVWYDDLEGDISGWVIEDGWEASAYIITNYHYSYYGICNLVRNDQADSEIRLFQNSDAESHQF